MSPDPTTVHFPSREDVLAAALALARPALPPALFSPQAVTTLQRQTRLLAPLVRLGFECRLGSNPQVDLQQCIRTDEALLLSRHLSTLLTGLPEPPAAWQALHRFGLSWADPSSRLRREVAEVWMEFDLPAATTSRPSPPSIFAGFREPATLDVLEHVLTSLQDRPLHPALRATLSRCLAAMDEPAGVSHVGLMLARPVDAVRLNLKGLTPHTLFPLLDALGWSGPRAVLKALAEMLFPLVDGLMIDLDAGHDLYPTLGVELFFERQPAQEPRWSQLLDRLVHHGLCTPAKRDAVLQWPGMLFPPDTSSPWPAALLTASLLAPANRFGVLGRLVNHLKLSLSPHRDTEAKAYLGYGHTWLTPETPGAPV